MPLPRVRANGIELFYDTAGDPANPCVLLVMGLGTQMIAWPDALVQRIATQGFFVVRYDNRDVGLSTHLDGAFAINPLLALVALKLRLRLPLAYTLTDMAADGIALLDALGIGRAHVVGASMGGMIAQLMAAGWPDRIASLTSIMSSSGAPDVPGPTAEVRRALLRRRPKPGERDAAIRGGIEIMRLLSYPDPARDEAMLAEMAAAAFDRNYDPAGGRRQLLAILADGSRVERLGRIEAPTLVIHGEADPLIPVAAAEDLVRRIPGARLERIARMAHDLPPAQLPLLAGLIVDHAREAAPMPAGAGGG